MRKARFLLLLFFFLAVSFPASAFDVGETAPDFTLPILQEKRSLFPFQGSADSPEIGHDLVPDLQAANGRN